VDVVDFIKYDSMFPHVGLSACQSVDVVDFIKFDSMIPHVVHEP
jgi:hypothetical protein